MSTRRIAVIGAGPVGLEAALYAASLGHDVSVYEAGRIGEHMVRWGQVRLFSPLQMNLSPLARRELELAGTLLPPPDALLRGIEHVERVLEPLAATPLLAGRVRCGVRVGHIGRRQVGKRSPIGPDRGQFPFRILLETADGEESVAAEVVFDCSGTYGTHNWVGDAGIPADGERSVADLIAHRLEEMPGFPATGPAGRVLLAGTGHSAATALDTMLSGDTTEVLWLSPGAGRLPYPTIPDDPLVERARLSRLGNRLAAGGDPRVRFLAGTSIVALRAAGTRVVANLDTPDGRLDVEVDHVVALVGYRPDTSIYRELQVHECYASSGPMGLSAALLAGESGDCLSQTSTGAETLRTTEPGFFILGAKSYGRNPAFLIRLGLEQVRDAFTLVEERADLDLHTAGDGITRGEPTCR